MKRFELNLIAGCERAGKPQKMAEIWQQHGTSPIVFWRRTRPWWFYPFLPHLCK
jgi:hypothetical protein